MKSISKQSKCQDRGGIKTKTERKKAVLLTLVNDWKKLCKKGLLKKKIREDPYSFGYISGELRAMEVMKEFINEAWKK